MLANTPSPCIAAGKAVDHHKRRPGVSRLKALAFAVVTLLASSLTSNVEARMPAQRVALPSVQGWQIEAVMRGESVMCSARQPREENGKEMTLIAYTGIETDRDGVWSLSVMSRNRHLAPGVDETEARLFLDGRHVITGSVVAIGDWGDDKRTVTYVRFEFPDIEDAYVEDIKAARVVEAQAQGLSSLNLGSLSPIITAIEECQQEGLNPGFWHDAESFCG
jgi:hypothetical protein